MAERLAVAVDKDFCTGCQLCSGMAPDVFSVGKDGFVELVPTEAANESSLDGAVLVPIGNEGKVNEVSRLCPGQIIEIEWLPE